MCGFSNKSHIMKVFRKKGLLGLLVAAIAFTGCDEHIEESSRYTFTGHTVASFLEENEEVYSSFIEILKRGGRLSLMKAYGQYTCFAPTNQAIDRYLFEQDSIWQATKDDVNPVWTGVTSPELSELSDSMCKVIAQTHLLPAVYMTTDMEGDIIPTMNMNDRYLSLSYDVDDMGLSMLLINGNGLIIAKDEEVENGVVHTIAQVLNPSTNTLPSQIESHEYFRIMSEAIKATGYDDQLQLYKDENYKDGDLMAPSIYKTLQCPYPANKYFGFSAFLETDSVFHAEGIYNLEDLKARCAEWYPMADVNAPLTSLENPLNQFVGYHLIDRNLAYSRLVCYKIKPQGKYDSEQDYINTADRYEFFETMSGKLLKVTMPRSVSALQSTILLNYYNPRKGEVISDEIGMYMNNKVYEPDEFRDMDAAYLEFVPSALNGTIHPIEKILVYNEDVMAGRVLNMMIRFDASALFSELVNNNIRWNYTDQYTSDGETYIPHNFCKNMKVYAEETNNYYLCPHQGFHNYQGDEMMTLDAFDFAYKLPPVPAGTYEIRMGYTANTRRHVIQFYLDDEVAGIPVDLRVTTDNPKIGFVADANTDDNGIQNDKEMKNRGYLKGPNTYVTTGTNIARHASNVVRKVVTTKYLGEGEHWLRFKNVNEADDGKAQFMHDYFELVPVSFLRNEDLSLNEKRQ